MSKYVPSGFFTGLVSLSVLAAFISTAEAQEPVAPQGAPAQHSKVSLTLMVGDRINLAVFERAGREEDKWPNGQSPDLSRNFFQRAELSGERVVQDDGNISLPFLQQVSVAGKSYADLEAAIAKRFEQVFRRSAFVTVLSVEHSPIFIVGPVRNPGSYKYSSGMTVLHGIALAGGMDQMQRSEVWQVVEATREETRVDQVRVVLARAMARHAVLCGERDGVSAVTPGQLNRLVGATKAAALVADEGELRRFVLTARGARESTLRSAVESARSELQLANDRIAPIEANIRLRSDRLKALTSLSSNGIASKAQLVEVENSLFDIQARKQELISGVAAAKRRLELVEEEMARFGLENQTQLKLDIASAEKDISDNLSAILHSEQALKAMSASHRHQGLGSTRNALTFEILRKSEQGTKTIRAEETSELEPGDLVNVKAEDGQVEQAQLEGN